MSGARLCVSFRASRNTSSGWFWLSTDRMTVAVLVSDGLVREGPPIVRKFIGQRPESLGAWLRKQGGFRAERLWTT